MGVPIFNIGLSEILFFGVLAAGVVAMMVYMLIGKDRKED